jgi:hypothetical protein
MVESEIAARIAARRAELDALEERLVKQLDQVRAECDELAVAERVWHRMAEQLADERAATAPVSAQVAGRAVLLVPHREGDMAETILPPEYQKILAVVRQAGAPVATRAVPPAATARVGPGRNCGAPRRSLRLCDQNQRPRRGHRLPCLPVPP